ncbi:tyrosine-type recombinase/integrase [Tabrizicola soli]|uniref:Tyrosine-type recombinase/integrase n=1 Tax=Tabrizicola soli TaxID=2185115 RepID=A0ABV7DU62_9RHOB|nr:tyrosine-type recombinase/integrase [Tabrizicola soli]
MPRKAKGARLFWRDRSAEGRDSFWEIRDGATRFSCGTVDRQQAEEKLARYIGEKYRSTGPVSAQDMYIDDCFVIYAEEHAMHVAAPATIGYAMGALLQFWSGRRVSEVSGSTCRAYAKSRTTKFGHPASPGTVRRELNVLQAAINYCFKEGKLTSAARVVLPAQPPAKERWLTRQEAAWLLKAARSLNVTGKHLTDFILHGLYTGSRKSTILAMRINAPSLSGGHVDTVQGLLYRKPAGKVMTKKRQGTARLPAKYLAHLRRQARNGRKYVVEDYQGRRVGDIRKGFENATRLAQELARTKGISIDLSDVTPHTLKHTAISWALQKGGDLWAVAGYFSTSTQTIESVYGHHSPNHQRSAVEALNRRA